MLSLLFHLSCTDSGDANWGGVDGATCGAASQTITVSFGENKYCRLQNSSHSLIEKVILFRLNANNYDAHYNDADDNNDADNDNKDRPNDVDSAVNNYD